MTPEEREQYVKYRVESSYKTVEAARVLAKNGIYSQSYSGTKNQFSLHFIKTNKLDLKYGKLFSELFDWRQKGDYANFYDFDAASVTPLFDPVLDMINAIEREINSHQ